jgi:hypothetical protein
VKIKRKHERRKKVEARMRMGSLPDPVDAVVSSTARRPAALGEGEGARSEKEEERPSDTRIEER